MGQASARAAAEGDGEVHGAIVAQPRGQARASSPVKIVFASSCAAKTEVRASAAGLSSQKVVNALQPPPAQHGRDHRLGSTPAQRRTPPDLDLTQLSAYHPTMSHLDKITQRTSTWGGAAGCTDRCRRKLAGTKTSLTRDRRPLFVSDALPSSRRLRRVPLTLRRTRRRPRTRPSPCAATPPKREDPRSRDPDSSTPRGNVKPRHETQGCAVKATTRATDWPPST